MKASSMITPAYKREWITAANAVTPRAAPTHNGGGRGRPTKERSQRILWRRGLGDHVVVRDFAGADARGTAGERRIRPILERLVAIPSVFEGRVKEAGVSRCRFR